MYKKLVYLSSKVKNIEVVMLIDIEATNLFISQKYIRILKLAQETIKEVKVLFAKRREITCLATKDVEFKSKRKLFWEDFMICCLSKIDAMIKKT